MDVYFDNAATTRVCPEAAAVVARVLTEDFGNPSSTHAAGRRAKAVLDTARRQVAAALHAKPDEVVFTSGGTEADNWAVLSGAHLGRHRGKHLVVSAVEHDAVRRSADALEAQGYTVTWLKPDASGAIDPADFEASLRDDTVFASVMLVNNETGAVNPIAALSAALHRRCPGALFHTDAVQAFCKIPFTPAALGADLITVSSHKIHGPKGAGALWIRPGVRLRPLLCGGGQEKGLRAGTEPLPAIAGFGAAAELAAAAQPAFAENAAALRRRITDALAETLPQAQILGSGGAPHILSLSLPGYRSEVLMNCLDADGICVSKSSACKKGGRSHVLEAMGLPAPVIDGAIRVSLSRYSTAEEADWFVQRLAAAAARLRRSR